MLTERKNKPPHCKNLSLPVVIFLSGNSCFTLALNQPGSRIKLNATLKLSMNIFLIFLF